MEFSFGVHQEERDAFEQLVEAARQYEAVWLAEKREAADQALTRTARAEARRKVRQELAEKRGAGVLQGSRDVVLAHAVRRVMESRGFMKKWRPVPPGEITRGRPYGDTPDKHEGSFVRKDGKGRGGSTDYLDLTAKLPDDLGELVRRACYWKSIKAVEGLRAWADKWGNGPVVVEREARRRGVPIELAALVAMGVKSATAEAIIEREELRAKVLTTGDIMRSAIDLVLTSGIPAGPVGLPAARTGKTAALTS